jgi:hypothetical protein
VTSAGVVRLVAAPRAAATVAAGRPALAAPAARAVLSSRTACPAGWSLSRRRRLGFRARVVVRRPLRARGLAVAAAGQEVDAGNVAASRERPLATGVETTGVEATGTEATGVGALAARWLALRVNAPHVNAQRALTTQRAPVRHLGVRDQDATTPDARVHPQPRPRDVSLPQPKMAPGTVATPQRRAYPEARATDNKPKDQECSPAHWRPLPQSCDGPRQSGPGSFRLTPAGMLRVPRA